MKHLWIILSATGPVWRELDIKENKSMRMIQCDECRKPLPEDGVVDWIKTGRIGIDGQTFMDNPIIGEFCSDACIVEYFSKRRGSEAMK